jgi:hypothetical protein
LWWKLSSSSARATPRCAAPLGQDLDCGGSTAKPVFPSDTSVEQSEFFFNTHPAPPEIEPFQAMIEPWFP